MRTRLGWYGNALRGSTAAFVGALIAPAFAVAQTNAVGETATIETVVVTATKRETDLQKTPIAITALTGQQLRDTNAFTLEDFYASVPGVQFQSVGGSGFDRVTIRGMSSVSGAATVGVYFDETPATSPVSQQTQPDFSLVDIQRVEVLRGPQGTLWGEGAVGGVIRYITNKPDFSGFYGNVSGEYGGISGGDPLWGASGVLNVPLVDNFAAVRLVASYQDQGGWIDNTRLGLQNENDEKTLDLRGEVLVTPTQNFSILGSLFYDEVKGGGLPVQPLPGALESGVKDFHNEHYLLGSIKLDYKLDGFELVSISSYMNRPRDILLGVPAEGLDGILGNPNQVGIEDGTIHIKSFTQELRVSTDSAGPLQFTGGVYYKDLQRDNFVALGLSPPVASGSFIPGATDLFNTTEDVTYRQWALFGEATYAITSEISFLAGLRYTHETVSEHDIDNNGAFAFPPLIPAQELLTSSVPYHALTPKFTLSYTPEDNILLYGTISEGFRSGGNNLQFPGTPFSSYGPDHAWNYEAGWKTTLLDSRLRFDGAIYYTDWTNLQALGEPVPGAALGGLPVDNIGNAFSTGAELEVDAQVTDRFSISVAGNLDDAQLSKETTATSNDKGHTLALVPKYTFSTTANYVFPITGDIGGRLSATVQYVDRRFEDIGNTFPFSSYALVDLDAAVGVKDDWQVMFFADNVTNKTVFYDFSGEVSGHYVNRPRTIGVRLTKDF